MCEFVKIDGIFKRKKEVKIFLKGHSYINPKNGDIVIIMIEEKTDVINLKKYEHWANCSLCKAERSKK